MTASRRRFLASGLAAAAAAAPLAARAQSARTIRVGALASDTYAEAFYGQDGGFFKKAGLNVEITSLTNGTVIMQSVLAGALDIGISNTVSIATAVIHGFPVGFIIGGAYYLSNAPTTILAVAKNAPYRRPKDLEGQTIAVSALRDMNAAGVRAWLTRNGVNAAKVSLIEMSFPLMANALTRGTIAAATLPEPQITQSKDEVRTFARFFDVIGKRFMNGGWFTTPRYASENRDLVRDFVGAMSTTARWANSHHGETAEILAKYSHVPLDTTLSMTRAVYAEALEPKMIQPSLDVAYRYQMLERPVGASEVMLSS
jgi:NitT/TauT family transport system substrate-binding protein